MPISLPLALLSAHLLVAASDGPPTFSVDATCKNAGVASVGDGGADGCIRSEREAKGTLEREWSRFNAAARSQCAQQPSAGGLPSYVEMLTCLELASGTVPTNSPQNAATSGQGGGQGGQGGGQGGQGAPTATGSTGGTEHGSALTKEPAPAQRTDPGKTLGQPAD